jgi:hypothetical protein
MLLLVEASQTMFTRLGPRLDVEGVLVDLLGDAWHVYWSQRKNVFIVLEEVHELAFLFRTQISCDLDGRGRVLNIDLDSLGILDNLEGVGCGGHGLVAQRRLCVAA